MTTKRTNDSARRVLRALNALRGHTLTGLSNTELAKGLGESPANITRYMDTLIEAGFATRLDSGRFAPSIAFLKYAMATAEELQRGQARITEIQARISAH
ncbi:helix-turn-helix domain-containing protein [Pseudomonas sp. LMG 31766]|jgi:DNA-binding IclR family transcriptional regulator|uniref:Helix-turn-helix domain-containing protein n=1 Tax=Pseudomonas chaetocerotis TaxID=2758695 RepID=A0A931D016_9PSED|nr:helix-turn-helix domain-containing protein [Pseudomonas chaetocerotis]MBZ9665462.1 helix-turn-helix domain-containing protein [Pseudomonas chaetocerotis]